MTQAEIDRIRRAIAMAELRNDYWAGFMKITEITALLDAIAATQAELARAKKAEAEMRERCARFVMGAIVLNDEESYEMAEHVRALPLSDAP